MAKFVSTRYTSNTHLRTNHNRVYLAIFANTSDASVSYDNDNSHVPFSSSIYYEPYCCPTNDVFVNGSDFVIIEGVE